MRKTEFLQELREALDGEVSASVIQSNISYYDQYISQEAAKGRREEEVIEENQALINELKKILSR